MTTKVLMLPTAETFSNWESGIKRVIINYTKYLPEHGFEVVSDKNSNFDLVAAHAGAYPGAQVAHIHGLYWSADYDVMRYEHRSNVDVTATMKNAIQVTVPSAWVAETIARDLRFMPHVIPHGIEWDDWQHDRERGEYILWNKNRNLDVCSPYYVGVLAREFPRKMFITTFAPTDRQIDRVSPNLRVTGVLPHREMKPLIQSAAVYLNTTKETFGIGILEAMASGVPVLAFDYGGASELIEHGVSGYLARPGDISDLRIGIDYCFQHRETLGANGREAAKKWTWQNACASVALVYEKALQGGPTGVSVIIPTYNYADKVGRAIQSATEQTYKPTEIIIVDDGSTDDTEMVVKDLIQNLSHTQINIRYIKQENAGVANARNRGISETTTKYSCCLDADDAIKPQFLEACIEALDADPTLGIAYTGLTYIKPNGDTGLSTWPDDFDYDKQISGHNQIPTCCVFRKEMWKRLGGYRQRYAPHGAGSEDAEFWLRCGAYGWGAKKATNAGLFIYSWMSGRVSGNSEYREVDWRSWHPWTKDNMHPFASLATPINGLAHPVRTYDEPEVSVIIPVGQGHEKEVINALDSLEAQTFRKWEAIVVWDSDNFDEAIKIQDTYPYIIFRNGGGGGWGAGRSRNAGANAARSSLLLFLDADDWLYPEAIEKMVEAFNMETSIIYTDYVGKAYIAKEDLSKIDNEVMYYDDKLGEAVVAYRSAEYDCERAVRQPDEITKDTYIWNLITSLVPKSWHDEIGGFDENMPSWEDWDYWIRLARAGRCFVRLPEQLVVYRFYTGQRRELGLQSSKSLLKYMIDKKDGAKIMACGCKGAKRSPAITEKITIQSRLESKAMAEDKDLVLCIYQHPNRGDHKVTGPSTGTQYGYRGGGTRFYVHKNDIALAPHLFVPITVVAEKKAEPPPPPPPPPPREYNHPEEDKVEVFDLQGLPGVTPQIAMGLNAMGAHSPEDVLELGITGLSRIKGIGEKRAEAIIAYIQQLD